MNGEKEKSHAMLAKVSTYAKKNSSVDPIVVDQAKRLVIDGVEGMALLYDPINTFKQVLSSGCTLCGD